MKSISLALLLLPALVFAQSNSKTELDSKIIRMPKFPQADFPKKAVAVSEIKLIQFLEDSVILGYVQKGMDDHVEQLKTEKPLTELLQAHIVKMYKDNYKPSGVKLIWHLKQLRIAERTTRFSNLAYAKIEADAFVSVDDDGYTKLAGIDTVLITESGTDLTAWHGTHIENALKLLLHSSQDHLKKQKDQQDKLTSVELPKTGKPVLSVPILSAEKYNEGAWLTFEDFINNKPNYPEAEVVGRKKGKVYIINKATASDTLRPWGICRNGEIYRFYNETLVPLEKKNNGFIISNYVAKINRKNANLMGAALVGGLIGTAIASSVNYNIPLVEDMPTVKPAKLPEATNIDMSTGKFSF